MSKPTVDKTHPLVIFAARHFPSACTESRLWLSGLPRDTTPAQAWAECEEDAWQSWARNEYLQHDKDDLYRSVPSLAPRKTKVERATADLPVRAFFARVWGHRLKVTVRCLWCDGRGCRRCDDSGKARVEPLHPADAWTLAALATIEPMVTKGCPL